MKVGWLSVRSGVRCRDGDFRFNVEASAMAGQKGGGQMPDICDEEKTE